MPLINANFDDIADEVKPIPAGIYTFEIISADIEPTKKDPNKEKVVLKLQVTDGEQQGRQQFEHIGVSNDRGLTTLKQVAMASGLAVGAAGLDTTDLVGRTLQARIKARTYQDPESGETKEASGISAYLWRQEEIAAAAAEAV